MEKNDQNIYSYNSVSAKKNADGSITINFGAAPKTINNLPITPGWNYIVRMYQPRAEIKKEKNNENNENMFTDGCPYGCCCDGILRAGTYRLRHD